MEVGNSGMFRPEMLEPMGLPPDVRVIAWGLSLERPTMILYKIGNIRDLFGHKARGGGGGFALGGGFARVRTGRGVPARAPAARAAAHSAAHDPACPPPRRARRAGQPQRGAVKPHLPPRLVTRARRALRDPPILSVARLGPPKPQRVCKPASYASGRRVVVYCRRQSGGGSPGEAVRGEARSGALIGALQSSYGCSGLGLEGERGGRRGPHRGRTRGSAGGKRVRGAAAKGAGAGPERGRAAARQRAQAHGRAQQRGSYLPPASSSREAGS
jgi:hypothetical protein